MSLPADDICTLTGQGLLWLLHHHSLNVYKTTTDLPECPDKRKQQNCGHLKKTMYENAKA